MGLVKEIAKEPDYEAVLVAVRGVLQKVQED